MNRILKCAIAVVSLTAAYMPAALAQNGCKPVTGRFEAQVVIPGQGHCPNVAGLLCTAGRVWGGVQGDYQFVVSGVVPAASIGGIPTALFFAGQSTILLESGGQRPGRRHRQRHARLAAGAGRLRLAHHIRRRRHGPNPVARPVRSRRGHDGWRLHGDVLRGLIACACGRAA
jgi:hypothetical protein